ncbi:MAG: IgGFc-binding protein [Myxococcales bacterium]|nr:IgGFc-binding protein [Myxococcales bacterium]
MRRLVVVASAFVLVLATACGGGSGDPIDANGVVDDNLAPPDAADIDAPPIDATPIDAVPIDAIPIDAMPPDAPWCPVGTVECMGTTQRICDGMGGYTDVVNCGQQGQVCVPGNGCQLCVPDTGACNGDTATYCAADGNSWIDEYCDPLQGESCDPNGGRCIGLCSPRSLGASYIGCDYMPTVTANLVATNFHFAAAVSNSTSDPATVTITKGTSTVSTVTVAANSVQVIQMDWDTTLKGPASSSVVPFPASVQVADGAYRLRSTQPVAVYQFNPLEYTLAGAFSYSNDASILLPTNVWGTDYRVASRHHFAGGSGFYAVTASEDNTTVTVAAGPQAGTVKAGVTGISTAGNGTVTLNAGDVIEIVTNGGTSQSDPNDVTGTRITSDKPIQVIGGHQCIYIPDTVGYCDHLEETMFPVNTLATTYMVTAPLIPTGGTTPKVEFVRVIATEANTTLAYEPAQAGAPTTIAAAGGWIELPSSAADYRITGDKPILVVQYMEGQAAGGNSGDPAMTLAVSNQQFRSNYLFHAPTNYETNYVNVVAPTGATITLDGVDVAGFVAIGTTGYGVARVALSNAGTGNHNITGTEPFGISVYGYGQYTSYWYPGGTNSERIQ